MTYDIKVSIAVLGEMGVGKSSLLLRFAKNIFREHLTSTILDCYHTDIYVKNKRVRLELWDTAGQERFKCVVKNYFRKCEGVLLVYDVTDISSFHKLTSWFLKLKEENESAVSIIVGNKTDHPKGSSVAVSSVKTFAKEQNLEFYECSAKTGENVHKIFEDLTERVLESKENVSLEKIELPLSQNFSQVPNEVKPSKIHEAEISTTEHLDTNNFTSIQTIPTKPTIPNIPTKKQSQRKESVVVLHKTPSPAKKKKCRCSL